MMFMDHDHVLMMDFMDRIRLAVYMLHYNVPAADKAAQPYQDSFARLVKAHFGAGLRPEIGKVVLGVTNLPADMDAYLQAAKAIESELARSCLLYTSPSPRD